MTGQNDEQSVVKSATTKCELRKKKLQLSYEKRMALYLAASSNKSNVFTSTRAQVHTYGTRTVRRICVAHNAHRVYSSNNRGSIHFHSRFTHPHGRRTTLENSFFFLLSSTSFLDIKAFNIERRIAMRPDSARPIGFASRKFRGEFFPREHRRFDKSRRCSS